MSLEIKATLYITKYAPSRRRVEKYLLRKIGEGSPDPLARIAEILDSLHYDESMMIHLWIRSLIAIGKSKSHITAKLLKKEFSKDLIASSLIEYVETLDSWDDYESSIRSRISTLSSRGKSRQYILSVLSGDFPHFRSEIAQVLDSYDDRENLLRDYEKKYHGQTPTDPKEYQKFIAFFLRKGYKYDMIRERVGKK